MHFNVVVFSVVQRRWPGYDFTLFPAVDHERPMGVMHVMGAAMLIAADLFDQLCGFDERFFLYFEETDLCRRCVESGREIAYVPAAVVRHFQGGSSGEHEFGQASPHYQRSAYQYFAKVHGRTFARLLYAATVAELAANVAFLGIGRRLSPGRMAGRAGAATGADFSARALAWHRANWRRL